MIEAQTDICGFQKVRRTYSKAIDLGRLKRSLAWKMDLAAKHRKLAEALVKNRLELDSCPICSCEKLVLFVEIFDYPYCECVNCGHIFSKKPPCWEAVRDIYAAKDKNKRTVQAQIYANKDLFDYRLEAIAAPKVEFITKRVPVKGKWVDIGCGAGEIIVAAQSYGWQAVGIESDPELSAFGGSMGVNVLNDYITPDNASKHIADAGVISLFNVLEHVMIPHEFIKGITDAIATNARVIIEVPRHPSLSSFSNRIFPNLAARHIYPPDHLHIFTEKSLELVLSDCGLAGEYIWLFGQDFYEMATSMAASCSYKESMFLEQILKNANRIQQAIDRCQLSDTMIIIARKI